MDGVSVNNDVLSSNNPLLVVNGRVKPGANVKTSCSKELTIVDANHIVATSRMREELR